MGADAQYGQCAPVIHNPFSNIRCVFILCNRADPNGVCPAGSIWRSVLRWYREIPMNMRSPIRPALLLLLSFLDMARLCPDLRYWAAQKQNTQCPHSWVIQHSATSAARGLKTATFQSLNCYMKCLFERKWVAKTIASAQGSTIFRIANSATTCHHQALDDGRTSKISFDCISCGYSGLVCERPAAERLKMHSNSRFEYV
jgi:hypothetical protein